MNEPRYLVAHGHRRVQVDLDGSVAGRQVRNHALVGKEEIRRTNRAGQPGSRGVEVPQQPVPDAVVRDGRQGLVSVIQYFDGVGTFLADASQAYRVDGL